MISLGIGLTNECNLNCAHCYRPTDRVYRLGLEDVRMVCDMLPVGSVGLGTGENALHPQFTDIIEYLAGRGIRVSMASNGYSINTLSDSLLSLFRDLEVSIDFPTSEDQERFRGSGNWGSVMAAVERCKGCGVEVTVLATMMNVNYDKMDRLASLARSLGVNLRVNVYQSVITDAFALGYEQFWEGYRRLFGSSMLISCSEPVVCAVLGSSPAVSPCGHRSVRVTPLGQVTPCVYWPQSKLSIADLCRLGEGVLETDQFMMARKVPDAARDCPCRGGCAGRRHLSGTPDRHDDYCPWARGDGINLSVSVAPQKELIRSSNVCTTIVC